MKSSRWISLMPSRDSLLLLACTALRRAKGLAVRLPDNRIVDDVAATAADFLRRNGPIWPSGHYASATILIITSFWMRSGDPVPIIPYCYRTNGLMPIAKTVLPPCPR